MEFKISIYFLLNIFKNQTFAKFNWQQNGKTSNTMLFIWLTNLKMVYVWSSEKNK